jgi:hypothetical protein
MSAAAFGPYFVWEPWDAGASWRPLSDLTDEAVAAERVEVARRTLIGMFGLADEAVPERVIASVTFLGIAARLVSPVLGAAVAEGALPAVEPGQLFWKPVAGGPLPMAVHEAAAVPCAGLTAAEVADLLVESTVDGLVRPVLDVFRTRFALSPRVLWGNVASALGGAAGMIAGTVPGRTERAAAIVTACLERGGLAGTGTMVQPDPGHPRRFLVRDNCCLYYRIPGGGTCGDCVLTPEPERRRQWASVLARR